VKPSTQPLSSAASAPRALARGQSTTIRNTAAIGRVEYDDSELISAASQPGDDESTQAGR
jgi:hypothetical protein